jgi:hypothetical protein
MISDMYAASFSESASQAAMKGVNQWPANTSEICGSAYHTK